MFMLIVCLTILVGCSSKVSNSTQKGVVKIKYNDISNKNKSYKQWLPDDTVEIHEIHGHSGKFGYTVFFKGWKPYKNLKVVTEGFTIKIYYEEKETKKTTNTLISWKGNFAAGEKGIQVYRNGKLVEEGIRFVFGME